MIDLLFNQPQIPSMEPKSRYLVVVFISLLTISSARGNYGYGQQFGNQVCDKNVYNRAKEVIRLEMQQRSDNQPQYDARYPALTNSYQINNYTNRNYLVEQLNDHQCKLIRQAFDDLLSNTPLCESIGSYQFQVSSDLIQQCRNFLLQYCERNQGWPYAQCFKRREIIDCENQFNYLKRNSLVRLDQDRNSVYNQANPSAYYPRISYELCQAFETFRNCVISHSRLQCYTSDLELLGTYFFDKAQNAAWSCIPNQLNTMVNSGDVYSRRTDLAYPNPGNDPYYPRPPYAHFQNIPNNLVTMSPYQTSFSQPYQPLENIDRAGGALSGMHAGSVSACIERVRPFESSCLDFLIQRQREARYGRSSTDVQRRICCALFRYRDCLSRIVLERCFDNSRVTVDILMGDRNREITQTCRDITRDQCNKVMPLLAPINLIISIFIMQIFYCLSFSSIADRKTYSLIIF